MGMNALAARTDVLDLLLFDVCDNLQLSPTQHNKAEDRYKSIAKVIGAANSPFSHWDSNLYSQGSMRLRTTVKPSDTPHDLDLVCEFDVSHEDVNPISTHRDNLAHLATGGESTHLGHNLNCLGNLCRDVVAIRLLMRAHRQFTESAECLHGRAGVNRCH